MQHRQTLSIVVPAYNEAESLPHLAEALHMVMQSQPYAMEIILVDDGSSDATPHVMASLSDQYPDLFYIRLSRNFGHQNALKAGLDHASGDAVISMAANFHNALNDYGIRSNAFMNGVIASGSNGSGTERACNENGTSYFFFCTKDVNPQKCLLYKDLHAGAGAEWTDTEIKGTLNIDFIKKEGAKNICDGTGTGCFLFTCMEVNPPQPQ